MRQLPVELLTQIAQQHDRVWVIHYATTPRRILDPILRLLDTHAIALDEWSTPLSEGALYALPVRSFIYRAADRAQG